MSEHIIPEGVSLAAVEALGAKRNGSGWEVPERNAQGEIVGWAVRKDDGQKSFRRGGSRGLTLVWPLGQWDGTRRDDPVFIVEGASDAAAGVALGLTVIGRPSATGGAQHLRELLPDRHVCIIAENDGGPGADGANRIAEQLSGVASSVRIIFPPDGAKDLRRWIVDRGAQRDDILQAAARAEDFDTAADAVEDSSEPDAEAVSDGADGYEPIPVEALPSPVKEYVLRHAAAMPNDPAMITVPLLVCLAGAIGNALRIEIRPGWCEPPVLWGVTVCRSGAKKSPALDAAKCFLELREKRYARDFERELRDYCAKKQRWEIDFQRWKHAQRSKDTRGGDPPEKPEPPVPPRILTDNFTLEALLAILRDNPRGITVVKDELAGWFGAFDCYRSREGQDEPAWLSMHRAGTMRVDRVGRGSMFVPRAAVCVTGTIQHETLARALTPRRLASGLGARLLIADPPRVQSRWVDEAVDPEVVEATGRVFEGLLKLQMLDVDGDDPAPEVITLDPEARRLAKEWVDRVGVEQMRAEAEFDAALAKLEGGAFRLALVIHAVRWVTGNVARRGQVDAESMRSGIELARWFEREARRLYRSLGAERRENDIADLVRRIKDRGGWVTLAVWAKTATKSAPDAKAQLDSLVAAGAASWLPVPRSPKGGRPTRALVLNGFIDRFLKEHSGGRRAAATVRHESEGGER